MKFSILMPVYNAEKYLEQSILSVIEQTYGCWELIIVNDGSTDNSDNILNRYEKEDNRIKIINQINKGSLNARVRGTKNATGEYSIFLDSDDFLEKTTLIKLKDIIDIYTPDMIIYDLVRVNEEGEKIKKDARDIQIKNVSREFVLKILLTSDKFNSLCTKAIKTALFKKDDMNYEKLKGVSQSDDAIQSLPLVYNAEKIILTNIPLYYYRTNPKSQTYNIDLKSIEDVLKTFEITNDYIDQKGYTHYDLSKRYNRYVRSLATLYASYTKNRDTNKLDKLKLIKLYKRQKSFKDAKDYITKYKLLYRLIVKERIFVLDFIAKGINLYKRLRL